MPLTERREKKRKGECSDAYCPRPSTTTVAVRGVKKDFCGQHAKEYRAMEKGRTSWD